MKLQPGPFPAHCPQPRLIASESVDITLSLPLPSAAAGVSPLAIELRQYVRPVPPRLPLVCSEPPRESSIDAPERDYACENYDTCLGLAAALDWESFTCKNCSRCIDQQLIWRARHRLRKDGALAKICGLD